LFSPLVIYIIIDTCERSQWNRRKWTGW